MNSLIWIVRLKDTIGQIAQSGYRATSATGNLATPRQSGMPVVACNRASLLTWAIGRPSAMLLSGSHITGENLLSGFPVRLGYRAPLYHVAIGLANSWQPDAIGALAVPKYRTS